MGDMQREAKTLWDSLGLAGRLSEQSPSRGGSCACFLSVGSPARWSAMEGGWGVGVWLVDGKWITGKGRLRSAASQAAGKINFCAEGKFRAQAGV